MSYIDLHCDTLAKAFVQGKRSVAELPDSMVDVKRLHQAKALAQFFAIFLPPKEEKHMGISDDEYIEALIDLLKRTISECPDQIALARNVEELKANQRLGKVSAFLTIEDGRSVNGSLEKLEGYYEQGIRLISLTWNSENCFGAPNSTEADTMQKGLTPFGKDAVRRMEELGMLVDVSHLSDGGFFDVVDCCKGPFVASHSNCRVLADHPRNLTDEMIRVLADKGGVAGINFFASFLRADCKPSDSRICDMIRHIDHMVKVGGEDVIAIGSDFDGISGERFEVADPLQMVRLFEALKNAGYSERQIEKFAYGNALRVMRAVLK